MVSPTPTTIASVTAALVDGHPEVISDTEKMLKTCEQLYQAGFLDTKMYSVEIDDRDSRSKFRDRFCDQTTNGGGWTVPPYGAIAIAAIFACMCSF